MLKNENQNHLRIDKGLLYVNEISHFEISNCFQLFECFKYQISKIQKKVSIIFDIYFMI